jgi:hypothetical protein
MLTCQHDMGRGRPMDIFHRDDWTRMRHWESQCESAEAAKGKE